MPHAPGDEVTKGRVFRPDLQVIHLDTSGVRYLVDVTTVDVTAATNRGVASKKAGVDAAKAEGRKTREYKSKVDGRTTQLIPAAFELCGCWGEGLVMLFKKGIVLATREGRNENGTFATYWKRRLSIVTRTTMIQIAPNSLRGHLQRSVMMTLQGYVMIQVMMKWWTSNCLFEGETCREDVYEMIAEPLPKTLWIPLGPLTAMPNMLFSA